MPCSDFRWYHKSQKAPGGSPRLRTLELSICYNRKATLRVRPCTHDPRRSDECLSACDSGLEKIPFHVCPYVTESRQPGTHLTSSTKVTASASSRRQQVDTKLNLQPVFLQKHGQKAGVMPFRQYSVIARFYSPCRGMPAPEGPG